MLVVHHLNESRSQRILWLLEELGTPYEIAQYQRDAKTRLAPPELKAIHPLGKSPVITDNGFAVHETGAIIEAWADQSIRPDTSLEAMAMLDPAFLPGVGTVTAATSAPLSDGAAALVVMSGFIRCLGAKCDA